MWQYWLYSFLFKILLCLLKFELIPKLMFLHKVTL